MLLKLTLAWLLTFPFGNIPFTATETESGTILVSLANGVSLEVLDRDLNYRMTEGSGVGCTEKSTKVGGKGGAI